MRAYLMVRSVRQAYELEWDKKQSEAEGHGGGGRKSGGTGDPTLDMIGAMGGFRR